MIVISNTSPLCYLAWIEVLHILPALFETLLIPNSVFDELTVIGTPENVRRQFMPPPQWLQIEHVLPVTDETLSQLHQGEKAAISLAEAIKADLILLDDRDARQSATNRGLNVTGLIGVLIQASQQGLLNLPQAIDKLLKTSFRISPQLLKQILEQYHE